MAMTRHLPSGVEILVAFLLGLLLALLVAAIGGVR